MLCIHIGGADAAFLIGFETFERIGVEEHGTAHGVGFTEFLQDSRSVVYAHLFQNTQDCSLSFRRRRGLNAGYRQGVEVGKLFGLYGFYLQIDEIGSSLGMVQRAL